MTYVGSEDWVRNQVQRYWLQMMSEVSYLYRNLRAFDEEITKIAAARARRSILVRNELADQGGNNSSGGEDDQEGNIDELARKPQDEIIRESQIRELRHRINETVKVVSRYNRKAIVHWLTRTLNARFWLAHHDPAITLWAEHYEGECRDRLFTIAYENGDVYVGRAGRNGIQQKHGVLFEMSKHRVYVGDFCEGFKHGKGRLE